MKESPILVDPNPNSARPRSHRNTPTLGFLIYKMRFMMPSTESYWMFKTWIYLKHLAHNKDSVMIVLNNFSSFSLSP